jgi:cytoskeletal protein CcmA (bactofilin family)
MKEKKREIEEGKITGFFDKDTEIKGDLRFKGTFRVDGRFKGTVDSESILIIGDSGKVEADIKIGQLIINGEIKGNIQASDKVSSKMPVISPPPVKGQEVTDQETEPKL